MRKFRRVSLFQGLFGTDNFLGEGSVIWGELPMSMPMFVSLFSHCIFVACTFASSRPGLRAVHWVYPYSRLRAANVHSTVQCLHLAATGARLKSLHFVSSTSVLDTPYYMQCAPPPLQIPSSLQPVDVPRSHVRVSKTTHSNPNGRWGLGWRTPGFSPENLTGCVGCVGPPTQPA